MKKPIEKVTAEERRQVAEAVRAHLEAIQHDIHELEQKHGYKIEAMIEAIRSAWPRASACADKGAIMKKPIDMDKAEFAEWDFDDWHGATASSIRQGVQSGNVETRGGSLPG